MLDLAEEIFCSLAEADLSGLFRVSEENVLIMAQIVLNSIEINNLNLSIKLTCSRNGARRPIQNNPNFFSEIDRPIEDFNPVEAAAIRVMNS